VWLVFKQPTTPSFFQNAGLVNLPLLDGKAVWSSGFFFVFLMSSVVSRFLIFWASCFCCYLDFLQLLAILFSFTLFFDFPRSHRPIFSSFAVPFFPAASVHLFHEGAWLLLWKYDHWGIHSFL